MSTDAVNEKRQIAIDEAVDQLERELHVHLPAIDRAAVEQVLDRFAQSWPQRPSWWDHAR